MPCPFVVRISMIEDVSECLFVDIAVELCDIRRELDSLRASLDTVLAVSAARDAAFFHQDVQTLFFVVLTCRIDVEEVCLCERCRSDEVGLRSDVRASLEAAAARHAVRDFISRSSRVRVLARSLVNLPRTIDVDPALNTLQALEHNRTVNQKVSDDRERTGRCKVNRPFKVINKCAACLLSFSVDNHHACAADLLKAVALPYDRSDFLAVSGHRILLNLHERRNNVQ